ncbi:hypothetical protein EVAR_15038_1 [Eumeta japonica]|uniref:Uncharacterized protein n=1 Tax=Eumeta variegata TaxID=151549 RepID=A0A4C1X9U8_EUMVA|nr:hypothetical protein EVAR_15038_1 [Eumeta japonica]
MMETTLDNIHRCLTETGLEKRPYLLSIQVDALSRQHWKADGHKTLLTNDKNEMWSSFYGSAVNEAPYSFVVSVRLSLGGLAQKLIPI